MPRPHILLVDDEPTHVLLFLGLLEETDAQVSVAHDGEEALDALTRRKFDLVLMDIRLPRMDGMEATRRIRTSTKAYKDVPIIGMTAFSLPRETGAFLRAGMNAAFIKPVDPEEFLETVVQLLPRS